MKYLWKTTRPAQYGEGIDVHGFFEQPSGVLEGQTLKQFVCAYPTLEAALAEHPDAKPGSKWTDPQVSLSHLSDREEPDDWDD